MRGWGAPDSDGDGLPEDAGWGDPWDASSGSASEAEYLLGWGEPTPPERLGVVTFGVWPVALPSTGGILVEVYGAWEELGPYRVQMLDSAASTYPQDTAGCTAPLRLDRFGLVEPRTDPTLCYTEARFGFVPGVPTPQTARVLRFTLPALPLGVFSIRIRWGASWGQEVVLEDAVRVVPPLRCEEAWRLAGGLPSVFAAAGARVSSAETLRAQDGVPWPDGEAGPDPAPFGPLRALMLATGEGLGLFGGRAASLLSGAWSPLEDVEVESPLLWPASGEVLVGDRRVTYEGAPDPAAPPWVLVSEAVDLDDNLQRPDKTLVALDVGQVPSSDLWNPWSLLPMSQVERAMRDTLTTQAEGSAFDRLAALYELPRMGDVSREAWRACLRASALGARGTRANVQAFLEGFFSDSALDFAVTLSPAAPTTLTAQGGAGTFTDALVGRLVRLDFTPASAVLPLPGRPWETVSALFYVVALGAAGASVELCPLRAGLWEACNFASGPLASHPAQTTARAHFLSFLWREPTPGWLDGAGGRTPDRSGRACVVEVFTGVDLQDDFPASYLLEPAGVSRAAIDPLMPYGSQLMDAFNLAGADPPPPTSGNQDTGPFPLYLGGVDDASARALALVLPAGVLPYAYGWVWPS